MFIHFHSRKCIWKCRLRDGGNFVSASIFLLILSWKTFKITMKFCWKCITLMHKTIPQNHSRKLIPLYRICYPLALKVEGVLSLPLSVRQFIWPHKNWSHIWAGIAKFAPNMHHEKLSTSIENEGHWPWLSMSFWLFGLRILGNLACLRDNL